MDSTTTYLNKFAISQSSIKDWKEMPPQKWYDTWVTKKLKRQPRRATTLGSYLDCLMFTPKELTKRFIVADIELPSVKVQTIVEQIFAHITGLNERAEENNSAADCKQVIPIKEINLKDRELVNIYTESNDHYKGKLEQAYNDIVKKGTQYLEFLKTTKDKTVVTEDIKQIAERLKNVLLTDPESKGFFVAKKDCEVLFQVRLFTDFDVDYDNVQTMPLKGAIDIVHINHKRKEIREVDLKETDNAFLFDSPLGPVRRFDYIQQHSFYDYLLHDWKETYKDGKLKDYVIMNPLNVVIDKDAQTPYIYEYDPHDLQIKRMGIEGTKIKGWEDTIREIAFHFDCQNWRRPMEHIRNGRIRISAYSKR